MINWKEIKFTNALALLIVCLCFGYFFYISSARFPIALLKDVSDIKIAMITIVTGIIGYYYGSSKSKDNNTNFNYIAASKKHKKNMEPITGYYVDIPENGSVLESVNGDNVSLPFAQYEGAAYTAETSTHLGLLEWDASTEITEVIIDGQPVDVNTLIAGHHPVARPK